MEQRPFNFYGQGEQRQCALIVKVIDGPGESLTVYFSLPVRGMMQEHTSDWILIRSFNDGWFEIPY